MRESQSSASPPSQFRKAETPREWTLLVVLGLVTVTMLLYQPALHNFFLNYDDPLYVVENTHVLRGLSWESVEWAFSATSADNWHPLTWISHMVDVDLFGVKPMGHHLDSVLWHVLNVVLLFSLLRMSTGYLWRSAAAAALFGLCPLNVECVAWVAERKSLISTTFLLLALLSYGWYAGKPNWKRYLMVALAFALGLMAKPMVITLPLLLLVVDYWPLERVRFPSAYTPGDPPFLKRFAQLTFEKVPLLILSAGSAVITVYAQRAGGALSPATVIPLRFRIENAIYSYALYVAKALWPSRLAVFYPHPGGTLSTWAVVGSAFVLIAITTAVWRYRRKGWLLTGWLWFVVTLVPVIGMVQVGEQGWANRYAYVPFMGLFVMAAWLSSDLTQQLRGQSVLTLTCVAALAGYAWVSHVQIGYWRDSYTLFSRALDVTSKNGVAEANLGVALLQAGRPDLAEQHFRAAVAFMPELPTPHFDLGSVLQQEGHFDEALREYRAGLAYTGNPDEAARMHNNIGAILLRQGDLPTALAEYNAALRMSPEEPHSLLGRGTIEYRQGQTDAALADLAKSAQLSPSALTYLVMGRVYEDKRNIEAAAKSYETALTINPNLAEASSRLAALGRK